METFDNAVEIIHRELISDDSEVRAQYLAHFGEEAEKFSTAMARAVLRWQEIDTGIRDMRRAYVSALVHSAISLHVVSFKLFLSGHIVPAGNVFRQVVESIALSLLCSSKELQVLPSFIPRIASRKMLPR